MAKKQQAVLVTTEHRGVFFGYEVSRQQTETGLNIKLKNARNCLYWSADMKGFMGLAVTGPSWSCRVGPELEEFEITKVTSIAKVTDVAAKAWGDAPWSR